jgi:hypothetical protein
MNTPEYFTNKLKELNQRYVIILDEVVKTYPSYKANPKFNRYEKDYEKNISNLLKLQTDYFLFKNNIVKANTDLQKDIKQIDEMLYELEEENKILREEYAYLTNSNNAARGMLTDSTTLYNQQLTGNWLLFLILSGLSYTLLKKV